MENKTYVKIQPKQDGFINVEWQFEVFSRTTKSGQFYCWVPAFDVRFACPDGDAEKIQAKARKMIRIFMNDFFEDKRNGLKRLALKLRKLGFKGPNDMDMKELVRNHAIQSRFDSTLGTIPKGFTIKNTVEETEAVAAY